MSDMRGERREMGKRREREMREKWVFGRERDVYESDVHDRG